MKVLTDDHGEPLSPSAYMRMNRPERFSDSEEAHLYDIEPMVLDHALFTLTERNEHKTFEAFARALAQREVCRNLRPATGPEGGGDGKIDSETYPVAKNISQTWLEGHSDGEPWAVAISAKKTWSAKVRADVKAIRGTDRGYSRILFFTNQNPRQRDRKRVEDELSRTYGIPVTVFDRAWHVEKTVDNGHQDLAYTHFGIGTMRADIAFGPMDTARLQDLAETEDRLQGLQEAGITSPEMARLARSAAVLERSLERPKDRVQMRFAYAEEMARAAHDTTELFRTLYDRIWTDFFWFDDASRICERFDEMRLLAESQRDADHLSKLGTIAKLLWQALRLGAMPLDAVEQRVAAVIDLASDLAAESHRPNNALTAASTKASMELTRALVVRDKAARDRALDAMTAILERCEGLAEFSIGDIAGTVEAMQSFPGEHPPAFLRLLDVYAQTVGRRAGAAAQGDVYRDMGLARLHANEPEQSVGYLGQALKCLATDETHELYASTLFALAHAYGDIGLHHAARGTFLGAMAAHAQSAHRSDEPIVSRQTLIAHTAFAWACLRTGHVAEIVLAVLCMRTLIAQLFPSSNDQAAWNDRIQDIDNCLGCLIVGLTDDELDELSHLPDALDALLLPVSAAALLYRLGHHDKLRDIGFVDTVDEWDEAERLFGLMRAQPASQDMPERIQAEGVKPFYAETRVNGVSLSVKSADGGNTSHVASMILTGFEAFAATLLTQSRVLPRLDALKITVESGDTISMVDDPASRTLTVFWPDAVDCVANPNSREGLDGLQEALIRILAVVFAFDDVETAMAELFERDRAFERAVHFANTSALRGRNYGQAEGSVTQAVRLCVPNAKAHNFTDKAPGRPEAIDLPAKASESTPDEEETLAGPKFTSAHHHRATASPIITDLWNAAGWKGMVMAGGYSEFDEPVLGMWFEGAFAGRRIFESWIARYGTDQIEDKVRVSVIRGIDRDHPAHYRMAIGPRIDDFKAQFGDNKLVTMVSRHNTMEASDTTNLDNFIADFHRHQRFRLAPICPGSREYPIPDLDVAVPMTSLHVVQAWEIHPGHPDMMAISPGLSPVIPDGETDPPFNKMLEAFEAMKRGEPFQV